MSDKARRCSGARSPERRRLLACLSSMGLAATSLPDRLWAKLQEQHSQQVTEEMLLNFDATVVERL